MSEKYVYHVFSEKKPMWFVSPPAPRFQPSTPQYKLIEYALVHWPDLQHRAAHRRSTGVQCAVQTCCTSPATYWKYKGEPTVRICVKLPTKVAELLELKTCIGSVASGPCCAYTLMRGDELLLASDANEQLGCAVAASGRWIAVGACGAQVGGVDQAGTVHVVQLAAASDASGASDVALTTLHAPDPGQGMRFGVSAVLSSTQQVLIVGADGHDNLASAGDAYVFELPAIAAGATSAPAPRFVRRLVHGEQHNGVREHFGCSLALSSSHIFVGARGPDDYLAGAATLAAAGAVHVFGLEDGAHLAKLTPVDAQGHDLLGCFSFGAALAASTEGILIVGAPRARAPCAAAARAGTAFLFREREGSAGSSSGAQGAQGGAMGTAANVTSSRSHAVYAQTAQLLPSDAARDSDFGAAVATFVRPSDGSTLSLIGAPGLGGAGAVYAVGPLASRTDVASGATDADSTTGFLLEHGWAGGGKLVSPSELGGASGFGSALAVDQSSAEALIAAPGAFTGHGAASGAAVRSQMLENRFGPLGGRGTAAAHAAPPVAPPPAAAGGAQSTGSGAPSGADALATGDTALDDDEAAPMEVLTPLLIGTDANPGDAFATAVAIAGAGVAVCGAPYHAHTAALTAGGGVYTFHPPLPSSPPPSPSPSVPPSQPPPALPRNDAVALAAGVSAGVLGAVALLSLVAYLVLYRARPLRRTTVNPNERGVAPSRSRTPAAALGIGTPAKLTVANANTDGAAGARATTIGGAAAGGSKRGEEVGGHWCDAASNSDHRSALQRQPPPTPNMTMTAVELLQPAGFSPTAHGASPALSPARSPVLSSQPSPGRCRCTPSAPALNAATTPAEALDASDVVDVVDLQDGDGDGEALQHRPPQHRPPPRRLQTQHSPLQRGHATNAPPATPATRSPDGHQPGAQEKMHEMVALRSQVAELQRRLVQKEMVLLETALVEKQRSLLGLQDARQPRPEPGDSDWAQVVP